jgi:hypothetical protein
MEDPVMDLCAHNFERKAIVEWLRAGNECCPISRKPLLETDLVPNHALAERIDKYWQRRREKDETVWQEEDSDVSNSSSEGEDEDDTHATLATAEDGPVAIVGVALNTESDLEAGRIQPRRLSKKKRRRRNRHQRKLLYQEVPAQFMLLPQERQVLDILVRRGEERRVSQRRRICISAALGTVLAVFVIGLGLGVARLVMDGRAAEEEV